MSDNISSVYEVSKSLHCALMDPNRMDRDGGTESFHNRPIIETVIQ